MICQRPLALMIATGALACATPSGGPSSRPDPVQIVTIESHGGSEDVHLRPDVSWSRVPLEFGAGRVWDALPTAYSALLIPIDGVDSANRLISGSALASRRFLRRPVSDFVDCGSTIAGPSADSYQVRFRVMSQVDSLGSTTSSLRTRVEATGSSPGRTSMRCTSSGVLERLVGDQVKEVLVGRE
jgi:hypothetical protein